LKTFRAAFQFISILILASLVLSTSIESTSAIDDLLLSAAQATKKDAFADLVVGVPGERVRVGTSMRDYAGLIHVIFGYPQGLGSQDYESWDQDMDFSQDMVESHDQFGTVLASGDFNGDGRYDVAVGIPFEDITTAAGTATTAGAVHIIYGSSTGGLTPAGNQFWHQDSPDVDGKAEYNDQFGKSLAVGNFNGDDYDDLAVGVPFEDFYSSPTIKNGGSVIVIYGSAGGLSPSAVLPDQMWHQDSDDGTKISDSVEEDDYFGCALAAGNFDGDAYDDLAIGALGEDSSSKTDIGVVHVLYGTIGGLSGQRNQQWEQYDWSTLESEANDNFGASLAAGDFDDDGLDDLAVGVPEEDINISATETVEDAGAVNVFYGTSSGLDIDHMAFLYQNGTTIHDQPEYRDQFGEVLAAVDFGGTGLDSLVVGVPHEDIGEPALRDAGALHVITKTSYGFRSSDAHFFHQGRESVPGDLEMDDYFARSLAAGDFNGDGQEDLAAGVPYDDCNTLDDGSVVVIYDDTWLDDANLNPQGWCQGGDFNEQGEQHDHFGQALTTLPSTGALPYRSYLPILMQED